MFVYPELEAHKPYRVITRDTPLKAEYGGDLTYRPRKVDPKIALPEILRDASLDDIEWLPKTPRKRQQYIDHLFITENGGVNLCQGYIRVRGIREGGFRLARHCKDYDGPTAFEVIIWGCGIFRETKTEQDTSFGIVMGETPLPKVFSKHLRILRYHLVPKEDWEIDENGDYTDRTVRSIIRFESTNLILADSYGELEQLRLRATEKNFMRKYLDQLRRTAEFVRFADRNFTAPRGFQYYNDEIARAWTNHIKDGIWDSPPESIDELSDRVKFLLESILIDKNPAEELTDYTHHAPMLD